MSRLCAAKRGKGLGVWGVALESAGCKGAAFPMDLSGKNYSVDSGHALSEAWKVSNECREVKPDLSRALCEDLRFTTFQPLMSFHSAVTLPRQKGRADIDKLQHVPFSSVVLELTC